MHKASSLNVDRTRMRLRARARFCINARAFGYKRDVHALVHAVIHASVLEKQETRGSRSIPALIYTHAHTHTLIYTHTHILKYVRTHVYPHTRTEEVMVTWPAYSSRADDEAPLIGQVESQSTQRGSESESEIKRGRKQDCSAAASLHVRARLQRGREGGEDGWMDGGGACSSSTESHGEGLPSEEARPTLSHRKGGRSIIHSSLSRARALFRSLSFSLCPSLLSSLLHEPNRECTRRLSRWLAWQSGFEFGFGLFWDSGTCSDVRVQKALVKVFRQRSLLRWKWKGGGPCHTNPYPVSCAVIGW